MSSEQFSLCWDNFHKNMSLGMSALLENEDLVDVTLAAEGKYLKAHKMVLSVCSPYFKELFKTNPCKHPIVFMKDVSYVALSDLLQFMYQGEVQVSQENLSTFIKTAEALQIKGLTGDGNGSAETELDNEKSVQQLVEDCEPYKQNQTLNRPKKVAQAMPLQSSKRQRLSTSTNESLTSVSKTKTQPDQDFSEEIQFKMEPYEQTQTITINEEEQYDGDSMNDTAGEETEDYSIIEGTEDEPQAGTSADGAGEGQDFRTIEFKKRKPNTPRYIVDGFVFHVNITKGNPPMIYLRCLEYKRLGCHARAVLPLDGSIDDIKINKPHNHPPDHSAEEKIVFMRELREVSLINPEVPSRTIYATLSEMYPNAARETPFEVMRHKINRWRRQLEEQQVKRRTTRQDTSNSN